MIDISNFSAPNNSPVKKLSSKGANVMSFQICISNHVSGEKLKEYIESTEAKFVITDSSRSTKKNASNLAKEIRNSLNINSKAAHEIDYWESSKRGLYD